MAEQPGRKAAQVRWQFIDSSTDSRSNLTQVKRHVMQEYIRQKRRGTSQQEDSRPSTSTEVTGQDSKQKTAQPRGESRDLPNRARKKSKGKARNGQRKEGLEPPLDEVDKAVVDAQNYSPTTTASYQYTLVPSSSDETYTISPFNIPIADSQNTNLILGPLTPCSPSDLSPVGMTPSPKSIMSAARTDPFNSLPLELDSDGKELFDFYVNVMPACSYGSHFRSAHAHNWYTEVFVPLGMEGGAAFQNTILVHAANTRDWVRNEKESLEAIAHRDRATSMLRDLLERNRNDISDEAIISSLSAAALEDFDPRPGHKEISWYHMRGAQEMIRARGGPAAFENTRLGKLINWQDYILSGYETYGPSFSFEPDAWQRVPPVYSGPSGSQPIPSPFNERGAVTGFPNQALWTSPSFSNTEIQHQCNEFIDFLKRCELMSISLRNNVDGASVSGRHTAFQSESLLCQILTIPPMLRLIASGDRKQFIARLAALMMVNAAFWDYRNSRTHTETFLKTLENSMRASEVDMSGSVEALLQILLACNDGVEADLAQTSAESPDGPDFSQYSPTTQNPWGRPWFVGRMLKVAKRLSRSSWLWVQEFLFACLTLGIGVPCVPVQEGQLRQEILGAPPTSYNMLALG